MHRITLVPNSSSYQHLGIVANNIFPLSRAAVPTMMATMGQDGYVSPSPPLPPLPFSQFSLHHRQFTLHPTPIPSTYLSNKQTNNLKQTGHIFPLRVLLRRLGALHVFPDPRDQRDGVRGDG